jgi:hypothetical protein
MDKAGGLPKRSKKGVTILPVPGFVFMSVIRKLKLPDNFREKTAISRPANQGFVGEKLRDW